jgi:apolipoprotein N-acyltransferase
LPSVCALFIAMLAASWSPPKPAATATAVLVQPNLDVSGDNRWTGPGEWDRILPNSCKLAGEQCKTYIAGIPQTGAPNGEIVCPPYPTHPDLVVWPESPAPFEERDPRFSRRSKDRPARPRRRWWWATSARITRRSARGWHYYNSALVVGADGARVGRYDKIHLVPFGEYIPFQNLLFFAHKLTGRVSSFTRGDERKVFRLAGERSPLRGLHLLRVGLCRRGAAVCAKAPRCW